MKLFVFVVLLCAFYSQGVFAAPDKVVCYLGSWSTYRNGNGKFTIEDIDPNKCTHLIYAFVGINGDGSIRIMDSWNEIDNGAIRRFNDLKNANPNLKTLIAMGGWNEGSATFSQVAATPHLRTTLANNIVNFLAQHNFDGFDFDWEYPGQRGGGFSDKQNFGELLRVVREALDATGRGYLLTAAVAATATATDISYDVPALARYLDFINIMAYDFHGSYDGRTGQNAPLYASTIDSTPLDKEKNVKASIEAWIQRGAPSQKLVLGMGVYGRSFTLSGWDTQLGAPTSAPGAQGPYTLEPGMLGYNEICELQLQGGWTVVWDSEQMVPYAHKGDQWVGYDNPQSIKEKVNFAKQMNLGGCMIWSIETDDFRGICGPKYPILTAINEAMRGAAASPSSPAIISTTKKTTTGENICSQAGYVRDPVNCAKFYYCTSSGSKHEFNCPSGLYYDPTFQNCNYKENVKC